MTKTMNRMAAADVASEHVDAAVPVTNRLIEKNVGETLRVDQHVGVLETMTGAASQNEVTATIEMIVVPARPPMKIVKRVTANHASRDKNVAVNQTAVHDNVAHAPVNQTVNLNTREMNTETNRSMNSTPTSTDSMMMSMPTTTTCVPNRIALNDRDAITLSVAGGPTAKSRLIEKNVVDEDDVDGAEVVDEIATRKSQKTSWMMHKI